MRILNTKTHADLKISFIAILIASTYSVSAQAWEWESQPEKATPNAEANLSAADMASESSAPQAFDLDPANTQQMAQMFS